jgi:hypothetical protein
VDVSCIKSPIIVNYENFSKLNIKDYPNRVVEVRVDENNPDTYITKLYINVDGLSIQHIETYLSSVEFATVSMKQILTIYVKRKIVSMYPETFTPDDPKLHSYISRLSYEGIKYVSEHIEQFAEEFKSGKIVMKIPQKLYQKDKQRK